jgi:hypothetical protein
MTELENHRALRPAAGRRRRQHAPVAQVPAVRRRIRRRRPAQKETDRTLYWIRVLAETPAAKPAAPKPPRPPRRQARGQGRRRIASRRAREGRLRVDGRQRQRREFVGRRRQCRQSAQASVVAAAPPRRPRRRWPPPPARPATPRDELRRPRRRRVVGRPSPARSPRRRDAAADRHAPSPEVEEPDPGLIMIKSADPQFPMNTMRRLRKGEVEVKFEVGPDGVVDVVTVMKTTNPSLNAPRSKRCASGASSRRPRATRRWSTWRSTWTPEAAPRARQAARGPPFSCAPRRARRQSNSASSRAITRSGRGIGHRLAVVVAVADQHDRAARGARRLAVVARVAHHQRARRRSWRAPRRS